MKIYIFSSSRAVRGGTGARRVSKYGKRAKISQRKARHSSPSSKSVTFWCLIKVDNYLSFVLIL